MKIQTKIRIAVFIYALAITYPAYVQLAAWSNAALDAWAQARAATVQERVATDIDGELEGLQAQIPAHLKTPLPMRAPR
jgi:hypothetical protein